MCVQGQSWPTRVGRSSRTRHPTRARAPPRAARARTPACPGRPPAGQPGRSDGGEARSRRRRGGRLPRSPRVEIRVARDPEGVVSPDLHVREQPGQVGRRSAARGRRSGCAAEGDEPGSSGGTLTLANRARACGIDDEHGELSESRDVGKGMSRVTRASEDREDLPLETPRTARFSAESLVDALR